MNSFIIQNLFIIYHFNNLFIDYSSYKYRLENELIYSLCVEISANSYPQYIIKHNGFKELVYNSLPPAQSECVFWRSFSEVML